MKPMIAIPCYNRPNAKIFDKLKSIPLYKAVFVQKKQQDMFEHLQPEYDLVCLPDSVYEIGMTRRYISWWCNKKGFNWVFMFDDDISKVELLGQRDNGTWNSQRIINGSKVPPRFEKEALLLWYKQARKHKLVLSSPNHRAYDRFNHGPLIRVNKSAPIQCVLIHTPSILQVGNYRNTRKVGNEDLYILYMLMKNGFLTGKIGLIEYDCPQIGNIEDGTDDTFKEKYERFVSCFQNNVCNDPKLIGTKTTKTGVPSITFKWKNWNGYDIRLETDEYVQRIKNRSLV